MSELSKRSTVYFEEDIHRALRLRVASTQESVSKFVNDAVRIALREDQDDSDSFSQRKDEDTMSYEELLEDLELHGKI